MHAHTYTALTHFPYICIACPVTSPVPLSLSSYLNPGRNQSVHIHTWSGHYDRHSAHHQFTVAFQMYIGANSMPRVKTAADIYSCVTETTSNSRVHPRQKTCGTPACHALAAAVYSCQARPSTSQIISHTAHYVTYSWCMRAYHIAAPASHPASHNQSRPGTPAPYFPTSVCIYRKQGAASVTVSKPHASPLSSTSVPLT